MNVIEVAFLKGRQIPVINRVGLASNKLGFGLQGYIDFGVNSTSNPFSCNQEDVNAAVQVTGSMEDIGEALATINSTEE